VSDNVLEYLREQFALLNAKLDRIIADLETPIGRPAEPSLEATPEELAERSARILSALKDRTSTP
jgi:hypothetical protein